MTELERRALLGDRESQEECTKQGILLPCPLCGCRAEVKSPAPYVYYVMCVWCGLKAPETGIKITALEKWNTRQTPPVGRCSKCAYSKEARSSGKLWCRKELPRVIRSVAKSGYCQSFKPKEEQKE